MMIYPDNFERKIGFTEIRTLLKGRCLSSLGTEWVERQLHFLDSYEEVEAALAEIADYIRFSTQGEDLECEFFDVREALLRVKPERTYLEELDLFNLKRSIHSVSLYVKAFTASAEGEDDADETCEQVGRSELEKPETAESPVVGEREGEEHVAADVPQKHYTFPALARMCGDITTFPEIVDRIDQVLNKYGKVKDTASSELLSVRHQIEVTVRSISHSLRSIIQEAQTSGYIDREVSPTMRDGRLMIPVASALKRKIKGIVHDESATGKTVFIEPEAVVEANNRIRELRAAERREVMRILQELTAVIRPHIPAILASLQFLGHVDYLRALQLFSEGFQAIVPQLSADPRIDWVQARHPLLELSLARHGAKMIPLDISLRRGSRILLISGPNAGGKSVCLKTAGLLQYMLQCGMPVPVDERSKPGVFRDIFMDMGDEQSLENDLSTYSSHLLNMKEMMRHAGGRSLLLIDEFGGGTEPQVGGALAEAILHRFVRISACGIITTHYQNLKHFAEKTPVVINGAMLYDRAQMQPLFILQIGNPGSSFAIEIARKIGIPEEVVQYAIDIVGQDYVMSDKYLQDIVRDKMYWENKRRNIRAREKQLEDTVARYEREMTDFQQEKRTVMAQAKAEAKHLLEQSNARIENTIRSIREAQAEKEKTREVRAELAGFREELERDTDEQDRIARKIAKIQRRRQRKEEGESGKQRHVAGQEAAAQALRQVAGGRSAATAAALAGTTRSLQPGDHVRIKGQTTVGKVESVSGNSAKVLFGMMFTQVQLKRLERCDAPKAEPSVSKVSTFLSKETRDAMYEKKLHFKQEIDLRGMRGEEAMTAVSYFIDDAIQLEQARVRILHGTGTGALRELVRTYLRTVPGVASFHDEHVQFGGAGITVVELA